MWLFRSPNVVRTARAKLVEETFEAISRCRQAETTKRADGSDETFAHDPHQQQAPEAQAMSALLEKATMERYKAGEVVVEEGTRPRTLFNLAKGRVAVEIQRLNVEGTVLVS